MFSLFSWQLNTFSYKFLIPYWDVMNYRTGHYNIISTFFNLSIINIDTYALNINELSPEQCLDVKVGITPGVQQCDQPLLQVWMVTHIQLRQWQLVQENDRNTHLPAQTGDSGNQMVQLHRVKMQLHLTMWLNWPSPCPDLSGVPL